MQGLWVCDACKSLNDPRYNACYKCRVKRGQAKPQPIIPGATAGPAVSDVYGKPLADLRGEPSVLLALLFGGMVAVVVTALWYWAEAGIRLGQGRIAWFVGFMIAVAVLVAGTLGGRRRVSFMLPVISFLLALAAMTIGEYLIISEGLAMASGSAATGALAVATPEQIAAAVGDYLSRDPLRPILWFAGLAAAWLIPWGALVGATDKR
jgi:hypothetical protein